MDNFNNLFLVEKFGITAETEEDKLYIHVDEINKATLSLKFVNDQLSFLAKTNDLYFWIGVIENLHNSLQGFMVLALRGTNNFSVIKFDKNNPPKPEDFLLYRTAGKEKLCSFMELYKKIKLPKEMKMGIDSKHFIPNSQQQENNVKMLHDLRNDLIHFIPQFWRISIKNLPLIVDDCIDIITFLAFGCQNILWHSKEAKEFTKTFLENSKRNLDIIKQKYQELR